ncbi:DegV family protein [Lactobacillus hominis]|uniref:DegV family protein n=1 Tax=Lactobacillus hominis DSM 23910 = CRBIP 24.179 TaxID=1423758 RepID=I7JVD4_9LACO|nr:DegV family protein [Lactobacillus hominis]KRM85075.1 DegV family protein [Lactobacillus hominis DSM 23910 = CRBIP 24.179]MCT3348475.1 DegV family protein [Lactobacillus hominis]CCI82641.1 DegV family protein [Lactobacillus hominis DSM 23910 = CRBIP 24.179]
MKIAIVTDSTSDITTQEAKENNITVVPIPVIIDNHEYLDKVDIDANKLFETQRNGASFPKTSQPALGKMLELFENLHKDGYDAIITITLTSAISGFYNTLVDIAHNHPEFNLHPFDSGMTVRTMGFMTIAAARMAKAGFSVEEIFKSLEEMRKSIGVLFVVDDLQNLVRGGRLSNASAFIGTMLQIKPLLTFDSKTYEIKSFDKVRSLKRAIKKSEDIAFKQINESPYKDKLRFIIYNSNDATQAQKVADDFKQAFPNQPVEMVDFDAVVATHLGEKSLGITWILDPDKMNID